MISLPEFSPNTNPTLQVIVAFLNSSGVVWPQKTLLRFQSETSLFKFLPCSRVDEAYGAHFFSCTDVCRCSSCYEGFSGKTLVFTFQFIFEQRKLFLLRACCTRCSRCSTPPGALRWETLGTRLLYLTCSTSWNKKIRSAKICSSLKSTRLPKYYWLQVV